MALALRFVGLLLLLALAACIKTEVHSDSPDRTSRHVSSRNISHYTVKPGDTLYSIARLFGMDYHELASKNHLPYPYTIYAGQKLTIHGSASSGRVAWIYKVKPGDTLYSIAKRIGIDYHELARRNHLPYPYTIYIGQELHLAGVAPRSTRLPGVRDESSRSSGSKASRSRASGLAKQASRSSTAARHAVVAKGPVPKFSWPLRGTITSRFGSRGSRMHDGIDIGAKRGTPVHAAADGVVVYSDHRLSGYGNLIILRHSGNVFTAYAHNQRNLVRRGEHVKRGDIISRVGQTGRASGPHLHFEIRRGSTPVDPLAYLPHR